MEYSIDQPQKLYITTYNVAHNNLDWTYHNPSILKFVINLLLFSASTKKQTPSTWVETMTTSRQACSNGLLTLSCEGVTNVNAVHKVRWKIKFPEAGWKEFSYCGKSGMNCVVTRPELPEGIKVLKVSNRSVNLQRVAKNNTNGYAQTMCQVLYSDNSRTSHVHKINFTAKCKLCRPLLVRRI